MLLWVYVDTSTLSILVKPEVDLVSTSTASIALFMLLWYMLIDQHSILSKLEVDFVDTSTFFHWLSRYCFRFMSLLRELHSLIW